MGAAATGVTLIGVRHHSPACARLVAATIEELRPAYVLVEGPVDMNDRLDELLLDHELPIAVFTSYRDEQRAHASWSPFCAYSPEWTALVTGRRRGAEVRFIDLPAWHPAFADRRNRYADAEQRYTEVVERLCRTFAVDNVDTLWDHLFEIEPDDGLAERLSTYFDLLRGDSTAGADDTAREAYMADWVNAARAHADGRPVVVVSGGFHRPALVRLTAGDVVEHRDWPPVPRPPEHAVGGSYLVPYSFKRLDAFDGYQSGLPSPEYYQRLWERGPARAAESLVETVVRRLRQRRQPVSTADLVAARTMAGGLARIRGHRHPARADVLDGLVAALVSEALDSPLPWTTRGRLSAGTHPIVVEMVAALSGERVGRLHADTPLPPLVRHVTERLERQALTGTEPVRLVLTEASDRDRSRTLHRLRVLGVPGYTRESGPATGTDPTLEEHWSPRPADDRLVALIEAGAYGPTLGGAALARLGERVGDAGADVDRLAEVLFDAALCGTTELSERVLTTIAHAVAAVTDLGALGRVLAVVLGLWRHDRLLGTADSATLGTVLTASVDRVLWLAEGIRGGTVPAEPARLAALVAARDTIVHAGAALGIGRTPALSVMGRLAADPQVPPDLRGAAAGFGWSLGVAVDPVRAVRGAASPATLGDWLAGLFALAREEVLAADGSDDVLAVVDGLIGPMPENDFLAALPALRQAFTFFPPREREMIARRLLARRGLSGSGRSLLRAGTEPMLIARAATLDAHVDALLIREGLISTGEPT